MVVKEKAGRKRYVAVRVSPSPVSKAELGRAIQMELHGSTVRSDAARLLILRADTAVVCCGNTDLRVVTSVLNGQVGPFRSETLLVSGTIKTIKEKYGL